MSYEIDPPLYRHDVPSNLTTQVELDAARAAADADLRALRDAARGEIAARELQLAAERNADQRMFLHELRLVAEEVTTPFFLLAAHKSCPDHLN